jgi:GTP-binding protein
LATLQHFSGVKEIVAKSGVPGGKRRMFGAKGEDVVIEVPVGTTLWLLAENHSSHHRLSKAGIHRLIEKSDVKLEKYFIEKEGFPVPPREIDDIELSENQGDIEPSQDFRQIKKEKLIELLSDGEEVVVCQGGFGGRGNEAFKGPANTTPLEAEYGSFGERKFVAIEVKLLADVGLVGWPNAGKSTLLSRITNAKPKIGAYPFTTLEPNIGILAKDDRELVVADIPGLVEGANQGKGLGFGFLRHVEHCRTLLHLISVPDSELERLQSEQEFEAIAEELWDQYQEVRRELEKYGPSLAQKPSVVVLSKSELLPEAFTPVVTKFFAKHNVQLKQMSSATGAGIDGITDAVFSITQ